MLHYGLDVHTKYTTYHALDDAGRLVGEGRVANTREEFERVFTRHPGPCRAAMESCIAWPHVYNLIWDLVEEVQLAHPLAAKLIAWNHVKTDRLDARALAILLRGGLVPRAYLAPRAIRDLRALVRHRLKLVQLRAVVRNTTHHVLFRTGHQRAVSDLFGVRGRNWLRELPLDPVDRNIVARNLVAADTFNSLIADADRELRDTLLSHPAYALLQTIPGVGPLIAAICIAEIGDIKRFPSAKQVVSSPASSLPNTPPAERCGEATSPGLARASCAGLLSKRPSTSAAKSLPPRPATRASARSAAPASLLSLLPPTSYASSTASGLPGAPVRPAWRHPFAPWSPSPSWLWTTVTLIGSRAGLPHVPERTDRWMTLVSHDLCGPGPQTNVKIPTRPSSHLARRNSPLSFGPLAVKVRTLPLPNMSLTSMLPSTAHQPEPLDTAASFIEGARHCLAPTTLSS